MISGCLQGATLSAHQPSARARCRSSSFLASLVSCSAMMSASKLSRNCNKEELLVRLRTALRPLTLNVTTLAINPHAPAGRAALQSHHVASTS